MNLKGHTEKICTIKKIKHPKFGECVFSQGFDDIIKFWKNSK